MVYLEGCRVVERFPWFPTCGQIGAHEQSLLSYNSLLGSMCEKKSEKERITKVVISESYCAHTKT